MLDISEKEKVLEHHANAVKDTIQEIRKETVRLIDAMQEETFDAVDMLKSSLANDLLVRKKQCAYYHFQFNSIYNALAMDTVDDATTFIGLTKGKTLLPRARILSKASEDDLEAVLNFNLILKSLESYQNTKTSSTHSNLKLLDKSFQHLTQCPLPSPPLDMKAALYRYTLDGKNVELFYKDDKADKKVTISRCAISLDGQFVYVIGPDYQGLILLDIEGNKLTFVKHDALISPRGLHVAFGGQVLVCGTGSNIVMQLDRELISSMSDFDNGTQDYVACQTVKILPNVASVTVTMVPVRSMSDCDNGTSKKLVILWQLYRCSIHGVEKPFPCEQCGKKFSTKDDLNRHVRREVAAKQFTCSICNATLREKIDLQAHLATHNGEKNFACDMCEKRYRHRSSLSKHRSAKHRA
ncbi:hypothetical protein DPMN_037679 [Dreissena polymorpha]|uniref:C2H2-type domain-containing protein n=1 Tax=Dreissena polymorpha TaxID=45954 RepID=A0A9D4ME10_DREPO|nr:hypothetical protein DPMN_037679 [Dreissena polymorpha]